MLVNTSDDEICRRFSALGFISRMGTLAPVLRQAWKAAAVSDITVLIEGETGTGKQVLAQGIHQLDEKRRASPFVTLHCGCVNETLVESELFGHERGAFSGAVISRKGLFQAAQGGTIFLDDVNDLPISLQPRLLDVLQRGVIRAVGSDRETHVDVRIISASNKPLAPLVQKNLMRADLYHRLNVVRVSLPALRERKEDIGTIALACIRKHCHIYGRVDGIEPELVQYLECQEFPGNVRELEHAVERALFLKTEGSSLTLGDWKRQYGDEPPEERDWANEVAHTMSRAIFQRGLSYEKALHEVEGRLLRMAVEKGGQTRRELASTLQTSERTLYHKLRAHNIAQRPPGA